MMSLSRLRLLLWLVVGIVAIGMVVLIWRQSEPQQTASTSLGTIGGPFTLIGTDGKPFASSKLHGKPAAILFGFTHCPDVCPTTLARLTKLRKQLGKGPDAFSIVLISVDPERDTPADLRDYVTLFDTPVIGLTGTAPQIEQVKKQFGAFSRKVEQPGSGYNVEHTAAVMLMDQNGNFVATLAPEEGDQVALDKLKRITA
jgi:protein SCO1/2